jgi:hypothetical protein
MIIISIISAALVVLFAGCRKNLKEFSFSYSMESVEHFKTSVSFDSNKTYKIETHNYYMDNHANKREPIIQEGELTDEEFKTLTKSLAKCNFFKMADSYGFDKDPDDLGDIMYQIYFKTPEKEKFISIRHRADNKFPASFINVLNYINTFFSKHKRE